MTGRVIVCGSRRWHDRGLIADTLARLVLERGGLDELSNLVTACARCNLKKRDKLKAPQTVQCVTCERWDPSRDAFEIFVGPHGIEYECDQCWNMRDRLVTLEHDADTETGYYSTASHEQRYWEREAA